MLTDDQLTRDLGDAFRAASEGVTYTGRRQPPRSTAPVALSIGAAAAVVITGAVVAVGATDEQAAPPAGAAPPAVHEPSREMVGDSISLAGVTLHYEREAGLPDPVRARHDVDAPPDDATPVPMPGTEAQVWVGVDPESGDNALYLRAPTRNGGRLFALLSSTWTQDQLVDLLRNGTPG